MIARVGSPNTPDIARKAKLMPPTQPRDTFVRVPQSATMQQLRQVAEMSARIGQQQKSELVDANKLPFGVELEMENFSMAHAQTFINNMPAWDVNAAFPRWKLVTDHSLTNGGEAVSPVMTLENGQAEKQIRDVLNHLSSLKGKMTRNCGLHIHVDTKCLGEKGLTNLMSMVLEQEHALFRLSQNGFKNHRGTMKGNGYRHDMPYYYCKPLAHALPEPFGVLHAQTPNEFRNALYGAIPDLPHGMQVHRRPAMPPVNSHAPFRPDHRDEVRYFGVNFNAYWYQGTIEFRLFEGTADPEQAMENVKLVLGMVAAAANGKYSYLQSHPLGLHKNEPVSKEAFDYFLSRVAHTPAHRARLEKTFERSGGFFTQDAPVTDTPTLQSAFLIQQGYRFTAAGKPVHSPLEISSEIARKQRPLAIVSPDGKSTTPLNNADDLEKLSADVEKSLAQRDGGDAKAMVQLYSALKTRGVTFHTIAQPGTWLSSPKEGAEIQNDTNFTNRLDDGGVRAHLPGLTLWRGFPSRRVTLKSAADVTRLAQKLGAAQAESKSAGAST